MNEIITPTIGGEHQKKNTDTSTKKDVKRKVEHHSPSFSFIFYSSTYEVLHIHLLL